MSATATSRVLRRLRLPTSVAEPPVVGELAARLTGVRRLRPDTMLLGLVVTGQAVWLWVLCARGWFFNDDFSFMAEATRRPLDWSYLSQPVAEHLAPGLRLSFWLIVHTTHLHYVPTIAARVVLQAAATLLLFRLLRSLTGSVRGSLVVTAGYAFCPLLVPATIYLASGINQLPSQACVLLALNAAVTYARRGGLRWAALCGGSLLIAACFWEKGAIDGVVVLVVLRLVWLGDGGARQRLAAVGRDAWGWLLMLAPLAVFFGYFLAHGYGNTARHLSVGDAASLAREQWAHGLWPSVIGGPWHWYAVRDVYDSAADPREYAVVLGQLVFVALLVFGWRRTRWKGLAGWLLPLSTVILGEVLVGLGRYSLLGNLAALDYHYGADLAVPTAIGIAMSCCAQPVPRPDRPALTARLHRLVRWHRNPRLRMATAVTVVSALVASAMVSDVLWDNRWRSDPAHGYLSNVLAGAKRLGPGESIFDTTVPLGVLPFLEPNRHLSDLTSLSGQRVAFDRGTPQVVTDSGHIRPAVFDVVARGADPRNKVCPYLIQAMRSFPVRLTPSVGENEYFLWVEYFQQRPTTLTVQVQDASGAAVTIRGSADLGTGSSLGGQIFALGDGKPALVTFTASSPATNICLTRLDLGLSFPAGS